MRKAPKSEQEIAEIEAADRRERREGGFELMKDRDAGAHRLTNGVIMRWHVERDLADFEARRYVPDDFFVLEMDGKDYLFEAEEFRRCLRWV